MAPFLYRCPNTSKTVQGFIAEEVEDEDTYTSIDCLACQKVHLINPATGKVLGQSDE